MNEFTFKVKGKTLVCIDWANVYGWFKDLRWQVEPQKLYQHLKTYPQVSDILFYYGTDKNDESVKFLQQIKDLGFTLKTKDVKYVPIRLDKSHFRKLFCQIRALLEKAKDINSKMSNKLYDLMYKIEKLPLPQIDYPEYHTVEMIGEKQLIEIFDLIEELDKDLKSANIDIDELQRDMDKPALRRKCDFDCELVMDIVEKLDTIDCLILFSGDGDYAGIVNKLLEMNKQVILVFCKGHKGKEYDDFKKGLYLCSIDKLKDVLK